MIDSVLVTAATTDKAADFLPDKVTSAVFLTDTAPLNWSKQASRLIAIKT